MFDGCSSLNSLEVSFNEWPIFSQTDTSSWKFPVTKDWLNNVAASGQFICPYSLDTTTRDASHVPAGWSIVYKDVPEDIIPLSTSQLTNDSGFITSSDVNDSTITLTQGGVTKGSFTLNQPSGATIELDAGGGSDVSSVVTPSAYKTIMIDDTMSSNFVVSSHVYGNAYWIDSPSITIPGNTLSSFEIDFIQNIQSYSEVSFSPSDTVVVKGFFTGDSSNGQLIGDSIYEKHIFTLFLNNKAIRQGVFYKVPGLASPTSNFGYYIKLDNISNDNSLIEIKEGDVLRLHVEFVFKSPLAAKIINRARTQTRSVEILIGAPPIDLTKLSNYNTELESYVYSYLSNNIQSLLYDNHVYRLNTQYTTYSGDNLDFSIEDNNFYTNDINYEIGDNLLLTLYNNSCFAFKTASNFSTYGIGFYDAVYYINKPFDLQADKCYIISYLNGVVVWNEMQEYQSN